MSVCGINRELRCLFQRLAFDKNKFAVYSVTERSLAICFIIILRFFKSPCTNLNVTPVKKKKQKPVSNTTDDNLEKQALSQLNSGHYKEAIMLYKKLLQTGDNEEWTQKIAYCYIHRARSFAARGMVKEAVVLWENHCQYVQSPYDAYDQYIVWLIESKNQPKIQASLEQLSSQQLDKHYPELAAILGLLMMTDHPEFQHYLPQDSALIKHFNKAQMALQAYQNNDLEKLSELLKQLPYRSAFRDFRTLLNAVLVIPTEIEQGQSLLAKIPVNSPYRQMAELIVASSREGSALADDLLKFNHRQCKIIGDIKGLKKKQLELIDQLVRQKDHWSDKAKFNLAIQYKSLFGTESAQQFCQALLVDYPAGRRDFNKKFSSTDKFEENRLKALACERDNNGYEAEHFWKTCVGILINEDADNGLKIALILRHIAGQQEDPDERIELLIESLDYDPEDRDSYLKILNYYSQMQEMAKDYKHWMKKAVENFPQDIDVLTLAINTATKNKTYKKASQYALKILKIDPLNSFAKQVLFSSYLAHARRLMEGKKYQLAEKEIQQAEKLNIGKVYTLKTQLMRGLLRFVEQDKKQGLSMVVESLNKLNSDPVNAHFQAAMEAQLIAVPVATILRELPPSKDHLLSSQELNQLILQLKQYTNEGDNQELIHKALEKIKPALKKSVLKQAYDESLILSLSEIMDSLNHYELLRHCVKQALAKWNKPIWLYYRIYSATNGMPERCSPENIFKLENIHEQAMQDRDYRTCVLIDSFLNRYCQMHPERSFGFLDDLFGGAEDDEYDEEKFSDDDPMEQLFGHIPEKMLIKLDKKLASLLKKTSPEMLIQQLHKVIGNDKNIMSAMMLNPDLFTALLMLNAADELGIDIEVTVGDVLDCFGVNKQADIFSFPF